MDPLRNDPDVLFQTACANYFLCDDMFASTYRWVKSGFKPLARIISSVTCTSRHHSTYFAVFQTACANYFLCDSAVMSPRSHFPMRFKPLARIISSVTTLMRMSFNPRIEFQTACANYFLCDASPRERSSNRSK